MDNLTAKLYQSSKTVLTTKELALLWQEKNPNNLKAKISYYVKKNILIRLTRGVFAKSEQYSPKELAASIYAPSYISFETVLREAGIIFQHFDSIFVAALWTRTIVINKTTIAFRKLKDTVLYCPIGIDTKGNYSIASPERAFLDMLYLFPNYYFDNLRSINWEKCFELVEIYTNQQLIRRLKRYKKNYAQ